jgi:hypothetical protein
MYLRPGLGEGVTVSEDGDETKVDIRNEFRYEGVDGIDGEARRRKQVLLVKPSSRGLREIAGRTNLVGVVRHLPGRHVALT